MPEEPSIPRDRDARPSLDHVLALRADRMATVRSMLADLTDDQLAGVTPERLTSTEMSWCAVAPGLCSRAVSAIGACSTGFRAVPIRITRRLPGFHGPV
jgi:hypothetical protein